MATAEQTISRLTTAAEIFAARVTGDSDGRRRANRLALILKGLVETKGEG